MMRKKTPATIPFLAILLLAFATPAFPQLSGIKTIGGSSADYTSVEEAILDLNAQGVGTGGVTFLIRDGIYNENDNLDIVDVNSSVDNPVLFRPDTSAEVEINITISGNFSSAFRIHNSDFISFNGTALGGEDGERNMVVNGYRNENDDIFVFWLSNGSDHCTLENMTISSISSPEYNTGWSTPIYCSTYEVTAPEIGMDSFTLHNCEVIGASTWSVFMDGGDYELNDFHFLGNTFRDFQKYGFRLVNGANNCIIEGNEIYQTFEMARSSVYGISVLSGNVGTCIHHNYIHDLKHSEMSGCRGIYLYGDGCGNLIYNNIINLEPGLQANTSYCLGMSSGNGTNNQIYYNTLYMSGIDARGTDSYCLRIYREATDLITKDNLLLNERVGGSDNVHCALYILSVETMAECDYNFISVNSDSVSDNRYVARIGSGTSTVYYNTLAELQDAPSYSPRDQNSITGDPDLSFPDLHLLETSICIGEGTPLINLGITTDFDYDERDELYPDIGADEFYPPGGVSDEGSLTPAGLILQSNYPNPFNPMTTLRFVLDETAAVQLRVYDLRGCLVRTLVNDNLTSGEHHVDWLGLDDSGYPVPSGIYFARLSTSGRIETRKMTLMD
jgi:hypothetical protein